VVSRKDLDATARKRHLLNVDGLLAGQTPAAIIVVSGTSALPFFDRLKEVRGECLLSSQLTSHVPRYRRWGPYVSCRHGLAPGLLLSVVRYLIRYTQSGDLLPSSAARFIMTTFPLLRSICPPSSALICVMSRESLFSLAPRWALR